jgi:hypothetical protein
MKGTSGRDEGRYHRATRTKPQAIKESGLSVAHVANGTLVDAAGAIDRQAC